MQVTWQKRDAGGVISLETLQSISANADGLLESMVYCALSTQ